MYIMERSTYMYMYCTLYMYDLKHCFTIHYSRSVVIQWSAPPSLSQAASSSSSLASQQVTYHTYVNHLFKEAVAGSATGITTAHLADIPRHQLVKISVRTVTEEGESPDPKKLIILNPRKAWIHNVLRSFSCV